MRIFPYTDAPSIEKHEGNTKTLSYIYAERDLRPYVFRHGILEGYAIHMKRLRYVLIIAILALSAVSCTTSELYTASYALDTFSDALELQADLIHLVTPPPPPPRHHRPPRPPRPIYIHSEWY